MFILSSSKTSAFCTIPSLRPNDFWSTYRVYMSSSIQSDESIGGTGGIPKIRMPRNKNKEKRYQAAREKRRKFIGMAKAVDRGQFAVTYNPRSSESGKFQAKSGLPDRTKLFTVLGVESSCDDTGAAVVRSDGKILGESLASQQEIHEEWGGVVPSLARDAHASKIDDVIHEALKHAQMTIDDVDAIGVTVGPGLEICLRVGCNAAKELAIQHKKPFVGVHHLEAHVLMARIGEGVKIAATAETHESSRGMDFPFLTLLVSGGHCQLMKCYGVGNYSIIGGTLDDSLGEAFDKTARLLGLPVGGGGGPGVEKLAKQGNPDSVKLPIPLQKRKDFDFSYAGLKTAVRMTAEKMRIERGLDTINDLPVNDKANIAASFQNVAIKHIEQRLKRAMKLCEDEDNIRTLAVVGGVAANQELRSRLDFICQENKWIMHVPPPRLCTDQGAMSAWASVERIMVGSTDIPDTQEVFARYPFSVVT
eukprot:CAMPEP_0178918290 /NCGR_PEP_ID=MMETSP0786-20121207/13750_1 /TAXON_ID=186022 /ORGANISM="Thalassionema frauenfeldii, Strain CCMP 1798" /LENGTH=476 /DNA_ID=CAMNT_0020591995 /DNA_START=134 /DNA_END=1564 /DNA_ORIENTATION=-